MLTNLIDYSVSNFTHLDPAFSTSSYHPHIQALGISCFKDLPISTSSLGFLNILPVLRGIVSPFTLMCSLCLFFIAFVTVLALTPLAKIIAHKLGAIDYPGKRRVNKKPIPRMGGVAVFTGIFLTLLIHYLGILAHLWPSVFLPSEVFQYINYPLIMLGMICIFITGVIDDIYHLTPLQKLIGQIISAACAVCGGLVIGVIVNPLSSGALYLGWIAYPLTILYLVAYVNIFNLIDGLDGLATGLAFIVSATMFVLSIMAHRLDAAFLAIALCGSTLGFLKYNFNPASIFLGDSGSLLIGFTLGVISLLSVTRVAGLTTIMVPLIISGIPIIDTFSAIIRRKRAHISISQADQGHIHHRLISEGFNQKQAVLIMYAWTAFLCCGTYLMTQVEVVPRICIFIVLFALSLVFTLKLHLFEPVLFHHTNPTTGKDELVSPKDPEFKLEEEKFEQHHHSHNLKRL